MGEWGLRLAFQVIHSLPAGRNAATPRLSCGNLTAADFFLFLTVTERNFLVDAGAEHVWGNYSAPLTMKISRHISWSSDGICAETTEE